MEDITDADYKHVKRVKEDFRIQDLGDYHYLYVQTDILLLTVIFENFYDICNEIFEFDSEYSLSAQVLA